MKTLKPLLLVAALFLLAPMACKKNDSKPKTAATGLTFKFNGSVQTAGLLVATYYKSENSVQILGTIGSQGAGISLLINDAKVGTYDVANDEVIASFSTMADVDHTYLGTTGKITITSFTTDAIAGMFQFSGTNGSNQVGNITEGTFSTKLLTQ